MQPPSLSIPLREGERLSKRIYMNATIKLDARLFAVAEFVGGDFLCDVGTDHANLPIYLCQTGRIAGAVASDINEGPLARAEKNVRAHGLSDRIKTVLSDGLTALSSYSPTDIAIAGMGGILIKDILSASDTAKTAHLVLQPMSHAQILREYLLVSGYEISDEALAEEGGKIYQIISARYTGKAEKYTEAELYVGRKNIENRGKYPELFGKHLNKLIDTFSIKVNRSIIRFIKSGTLHTKCPASLSF